MKIWVNTIVNNEENFLWFSVASIAPFVDKILIWDSGSTDKTLAVIQSLKQKFGQKISFKQVGPLDHMEFTKMRQSMLEASNCDWILILDGDEIWWKKSIQQLVLEINNGGKNWDGFVVPMVVPVGDIFHIQSDQAGRYQLLGKKGHFSLKAINRKIAGLHVDWPYGKEGFFDGQGKLIQERKRIKFINAPFLHVTHLSRSNEKRRYDKFKYEIGRKVKKDFVFPEVLYEKYPAFIQSPWVRISGTKLIKARLLTPLRKVKRTFVL